MSFSGDHEAPRSPRHLRQPTGFPSQGCQSQRQERAPALEECGWSEVSLGLRPGVCRVTLGVSQASLSHTLSPLETLLPAAQVCEHPNPTRGFCTLLSVAVMQA